jgi:diacylglycerol kinase (ATP)
VEAVVSSATITRQPAEASSGHLVLIANMRSSGVGRELVSSAVAALRSNGARVAVRETESMAELEEVVVGESRRLVLLGGDGSVHALANLPGQRAEIALLPAGRANNIARSLGVPLDLRAAAKLASEGAGRDLDLISVKNDEREYLAVEGVSVGYLALSRVRYHGENSGDLSAALRAGLAALARFQPFPLAVEWDGNLEALRVSQFFVANLALYSFGLCVAPMADPTDHRLDLVAIESRTRPGLVRVLARLHAGKYNDTRGVRHWRAKRLRLSSGASPVVADSEDLGWCTVELEPAPGALRVVLPTL